MREINFPPRYSYDFTIFIPTYNRAHLLSRTLESIWTQSYKDFEVIIIDDGSEDNTKQVVQQWIEKSYFPIRYFYQINRGKPSAHNRAVRLARGYFFMCLDSDDILAPTALEDLKNAWNDIPADERKKFAGVEGNCHFLQNKKIAGTYFPRDILDCSFLEMRYKFRIKGDKKGFILTEILRKFLFPIFPYENHIRESIVWSRISGNLLFRYINKPIQYIEQFQDGLTGKHNDLKIKNPKSFSLSFLEIINYYSRYYTKRELYKYMVRYITFSLISKKNIFQQYYELKPGIIRLFWIFALPEGLIKTVKSKLTKKVN